MSYIVAAGEGHVMVSDQPASTVGSVKSASRTKVVSRLHPLEGLVEVTLQDPGVDVPRTKGSVNQYQFASDGMVHSKSALAAAVAVISKT